MGGMNGEDAAELRRNKMMTLDEGGSAEWLIKNLNDTLYREHQDASAE